MMSNLVLYRISNGNITEAFAPDKWYDAAGIAIGTIATVATPTTGKRLRLLGGSISVSAAVSVLFEDNAAGAANFIRRTPKLVADTPYQLDFGPRGVLLSAANNVVKATGSGAANLTGTLWGIEE